MPITLDGTTGITAPLLQNGNSNVAVAANGNVTISSNGLSRMVIDTNGRMRLPYQPAFTAYKNDGSAYGTVGTVVFNTILLNRGSHYNNSTGIFTAPVSGVYQFGFFGHTETVNNVGRIIVFQKNGSDIIEIYTLPNSTRNMVGKTIFVDMSTNDTMNMRLTAGDFWSGNTSGMMFTGLLIG